MQITRISSSPIALLVAVFACQIVRTSKASIMSTEKTVPDLTGSKAYFSPSKKGSVECLLECLFLMRKTGIVLSSHVSMDGL
jgi:hypothetical protein